MPAADLTLTRFLTNSFGERYLHAVNRTTFNKVGAPAAFRQHFGNGLWDEDTLNVVIGSDSGLLIEFVNNHGVPPGSRFIFIEPPEILAAVQQRFADVALNPRITLCGPDEWKSAAQRCDFESYVYVEKLKLLVSIGAADAFFAAYRDLHRTVKSHLDSWIWGLRTQLGSSTFIACQLANLAENHTPALCLQNAFAGRTALILAGGPSLDAILPWAKAQRDRLVIIAVSRISRRLLQEQLVPHFVFSIDPTALSFDISKEMLELDPNVVFCNAYHVHPPLLGQWRGRHLYLGERFPWRTPLNRPNVAVGGPTVTNTALGAAIEMGFAQIILGGVDLCHSPEGFSHASGSNEHKAGPLLGHVGQWVETNSGQMAETEESLAQAVHDIGRQALYARNRGCRIVNPAPHAARIAHVDHVALHDIHIEPLPITVEDVLRNAIPAHDTASRRRDLEEALEELNHVAAELREIKQLAADALECNMHLFGRGTKAPDFKYKVRMDKIENKLDQRYKDIAPLVKSFGIGNFLRIVRPDSEKEWRDEDIEITGRLYYESYRDGAQALLDAVLDTCKRVQSRLEEDAPQPDFTALCAQWRDDAQPGRARVWRHRHVDRGGALPAEFDALDAAYQRRLNDVDTAHMARCRRHADLAGVQSKAVMMFHNRDREGLARLRDGLRKHPDASATPYMHLVDAYLAEFDQRYDDALRAYEQITDGPLLEDVLLRISSLTLLLERYDEAVLAMKCLAAISPSYMPMYAELLNITGAAADAAEVYASYLERVPDDLSAVLKLGKLYTEQGIEDGARWAYEYVLQQEPDNAAARVLLAQINGVALPA